MPGVTIRNFHVYKEKWTKHVGKGLGEGLIKKKVTGLLSPGAMGKFSEVWKIWDKEFCLIVHNILKGLGKI